MPAGMHRRDIKRRCYHSPLHSARREGRKFRRRGHPLGQARAEARLGYRGGRRRHGHGRRAVPGGAGRPGVHPHGHGGHAHPLRRLRPGGAARHIPGGPRRTAGRSEAQIPQEHSAGCPGGLHAPLRRRFPVVRIRDVRRFPRGRGRGMPHAQAERAGCRDPRQAHRPGVRSGGGRIHPRDRRRHRDPEPVGHGLGVHRGRRGRRPGRAQDIRHPREREGAGGHRLRPLPGPRFRGAHVRGRRRRPRQVRRGGGPGGRLPHVQRLLRQGLPRFARPVERGGPRPGDRQRDALQARHARRGGGPPRRPRRRPRRRIGRRPGPRARVREDIKCGKFQSASCSPRTGDGPPDPAGGRGGCAPAQRKEDSTR